jgi:hypothetical protein
MAVTVTVTVTVAGFLWILCTFSCATRENHWRTVRPSGGKGQHPLLQPRRLPERSGFVPLESWETFASVSPVGLLGASLVSN